jgi:hypothetical protein
LPWELRRRALVAAPAVVSMAHSVARACIIASWGLLVRVNLHARASIDNGTTRSCTRYLRWWNYVY